MRLHLLVAGMAAAGLTAFSAQAQTQASSGGQYGDGLRRMLTAAAAGTCPDDVMGEGLLTACQAQINQMAPALAGLGAIDALTFISADDTPTGRVETWRVRFAGGQTMNWAIGGISNGKFETAYTRGE
jgi:hypothetical protein